MLVNGVARVCIQVWLPVHVTLGGKTDIERKRKEKTTLLSVIKEKLMINLSFPLALSQYEGGRGKGGGGGKQI